MDRPISNVTPNVVDKNGVVSSMLRPRDMIQGHVFRPPLVPAQRMRIADPLSQRFDWTTLSLAAGRVRHSR